MEPISFTLVSGAISLAGLLVSAYKARRAQRDVEQAAEEADAELLDAISAARTLAPAGVEGEESTTHPVEGSVETRSMVPNAHTDIIEGEALKADDLKSAVREIIGEIVQITEADRDARSKERKADRRLSISLAFGGFFLGSLVTVFVSWLFAVITGVL